MIIIAIIMDGNALAKRIRIQIKKHAARLPQPPQLAVIIVGDDPASQIYVANKERDCERCGFVSHAFRLEADYGEEKLMALIRTLNTRADIHGILVQLPLPAGYRTEAVIRAIAPEKDVDAFQTVAGGNFPLQHSHRSHLFYAAPDKKADMFTSPFLPCTPAGVMALLDEYEIDPRGKHAVVVGRSNIVGKPAAMMLLQRNATVTICHSTTVDLAMHTRMADILVCAVGKANMITAGMVKPGAAVIDVGINRVGGTICGDADFEAVREVASHISPVPGGVGPMTRAMLMRNTLLAAHMAFSYKF